MVAIDTVILIGCATATLGWCIFVWMKRGAGAWRAPLVGAFAIGAAGAVLSGALERLPLAETAALALVCGGAAAAVTGAVQFSVWVRDKGSERRERQAASAARPGSPPPPPPP